MWTDGQTCKARALDESSQIVGVFCYCVNLYILLYKIIYDGIHGTAILWFKSLVENRRRVEIWHNEPRKTFSNWETLKSGVPQGSILSP